MIARLARVLTSALAIVALASPPAAVAAAGVAGSGGAAAGGTGAPAAGATTPTTTYVPTAAATTPGTTATTPGTPTTAGTSTPTKPGAATTPGTSTAPVGAATTAQQPAGTAKASKGKGGGLSSAAIAIVALGALLVLACVAWALARRRAFEPHWLLSLRHSMAEAGFRASATWSEFADWARLGR